MTSNWDAVVIGGGAGGFMSALSAKVNQPNLRILILEGSPRVLAKVQISGGGRCNVTHDCNDPSHLLAHYPRGHKSLLQNFRQFGPLQTRHWFESRGVPLKTEADGRIFPQSDTSQSIIDCLLNEAKRLGVKIQTGQSVRGLNHMNSGGGFEIQTDSENIHAQKIVLATGSAPSGVKLAAAMGHRMIAGVPSLFTFCIDDAALTSLAGVSVNPVRGHLKISGHDPCLQQGALLITHWGVSGPCILKLSAWGARALAAVGYQAPLIIDWLPNVSSEALRGAFNLAKQHQPQKQLKNLHCELLSPLPQRFWEYLLCKLDVPCDRIISEVKDKTLNRLAESLKHWPLTITGKGVFKEEFVTAGGVALSDIHLPTYESLICPGLYVVGELLNIDGVTGGFNFQNAWTSGYLAGRAIAQKAQQ
ncbi:MAG: NAD(P)/FAD-dependent oxidoreductase [Vampirovibrionales bacterium]|nr:NAD(P)/FAD-dependent oxidoreductase [Vampirovibrionales bacterium]